MEADLTGANLTRARFPRADVATARLKRAKPTSARLTDLDRLVPYQLRPQQQSAAASLPPHLRRKHPPVARHSPAGDLEHLPRLATKVTGVAT
ncbi:MAG: pentapeptide repeat-containing protein [Pseudonocardiaceae bacterium]